MPALRVDGEPSVEFLDRVLLLRGGALLEECHLAIDLPSEGDVPYINLWIRLAVQLCQVRALFVVFYAGEEQAQLSGIPLISKRLEMLRLDDLYLEDGSLDFSSCRALRDLMICAGSIDATKILSGTLERLMIANCVFGFDIRALISTPRLVSLQLVRISSPTPVLGSMPSLKVADVRLGKQCDDRCVYDYNGDCGNFHCEGYYSNANTSCGDGCVLLKGLSNATDLKLSTLYDSDMFILQGI